MSTFNSNRLMRSKKLFFAFTGFLVLLISNLASCRDVGQSHRGDKSGKTIAPVVTVVFGEIHGTSESPALFEKYVTDFVRTHGAQVVVGLEVPPDALEEAKKAARTSKDPTQAANLLEASLFWKKSWDGRSSAAMFELISSLSRLEEEGKLSLIGLDKRVTGKEKFGQMAAEILRPSIGRASLILLTGSGHAHMDGSDNSVASSLSALGADVASVLVRGQQGTAWICTQGTCGEHPISKQPCIQDFRSDAVASGHESTVCLKEVTASRPLTLIASAQ